MFFMETDYVEMLVATAIIVVAFGMLALTLAFLHTFIRESYNNLGDFRQSKIEYGIKPLNDYHEQIPPLIEISNCLLSFDDPTHIYNFYRPR